MDIQQSITNQTNVSVTLANHLYSKQSSKSNVVFSPLSIHVVLSLIAGGSNGKTLDQLLSFLRALSCISILSLIAGGSKGKTLDQLLSFLRASTVHDLNALSTQLVNLMANGSPSGGPRLSFANGVWVEQTVSLKPSFKQVLDTVYNAASYQVDFQKKAAEITYEVNLWAHQQTSGLIKEILPAGAVNSDTRLIFANAVYFKGAWNEKFDPSKTKDYDFHLLDGSKVKVPFMTSKEKQFVHEYDGFKVLRLPYSQGEDERRFTMYFFLPNEKDGLPQLIQKIGSESDFLDHHIPHRKTEVGQFLIPIFKTSFGFEASDMLKELGLVLPFNGEEGLTEMMDPSVGQQLYVSSIHHKSFIEVNEEGTEAAAVTAGVFMCRSAWTPDVKVDFVADHPFLLLNADDESWLILCFYMCYKSSESDFLDHHIPHRKTEVGQFLIPKFKISFGFEASDMLKELGLVLPFNGEEGLTEMMDPSVGQQLYVSSIHHKSFIEVNEEGTEAAAVTAGLFMCRSAWTPDVKVNFVADHPFLFVIREDISGVVLFMGQVIDPQLA
ncbi:Protease inhibitor I4, serpin, conserved site-containing protein [Artemisia annua]|uniref:Protease inhibitor I4, serpin, conserved site-containing protein n=1 Tax=Artemisia annua TaxID=35608 RepID=A0A2U1MFD2_ARTAN|nr:Protease inhibitor I4, serpin, conserved site-containing protein [Artemisia annua]